MESTQNTLTINDRRHESDSVDYLSCMPIELLLHIFSFLPLKFWVLMSLVSKRWKYFWTQISILELNEVAIVRSILKNNTWCSVCDELHNYYAHDHGCHLHLRKEATKKFFSIIDRILLLHSGCPITRFSLFIDYSTLKGYTSRIDTWVDFALRSNIESFELNFSGGRILPNNLRTLHLNMFAPYRFKNSYFAPKMVKNLTLIGCMFDVYAFTTFNSLQRLSLFDVEINRCQIGEIFFICPLLEVLTLKRCLFLDDFMICEEELKIRELYLIDCMSYSMRAFPISIIAPSLTTLTFIGQNLTSSSIKKSTNLVNAEVVLKCRFSHPALGNYMAAVLIDLSHCQYLELNSCCIQVLGTIRDSLPMQFPLEFQDLRNLRLRMNMFKPELPGLAYLISCCPNLETLNLDTDLTDDFQTVHTILDAIFIMVIRKQSLCAFSTGAWFEEDNYWESQFFRLHCLQNSLKKVNMNGFSGRKIEMHIVKFLLQNAMVLEELNIIHARPIISVSNEQMFVYRRLTQHNCGLIRNFKKASPDVRIKVV